MVSQETTAPMERRACLPDRVPPVSVSMAMRFMVSCVLDWRAFTGRSGEGEGGYFSADVSDSCAVVSVVSSIAGSVLESASPPSAGWFSFTSVFVAESDSSVVVLS